MYIRLKATKHKSKVLLSPEVKLFYTHYNCRPGDQMDPCGHVGINGYSIEDIYANYLMEKLPGYGLAALYFVNCIKMSVIVLRNVTI